MTLGYFQEVAADLLNNNNIAEFFEVNIQFSICVCINFPFIAYTHDNLCQKLETIFNLSVKGANNY